MGADIVEPLAPLPFSVLWLILGLLVMLGSVALFVLPKLLRRRRAATPGEPDAVPQEVIDPRAAVLGEIDRIEAEWRDGELTDRAAAQSIATAVKKFAGSETATMTLLDLKARDDLQSLAEMISMAYPVEFGVSGEGDVPDLARRAREVVAA
ncbi:MAG: hypothetical protein LBE08_04470 [Bifidobacteriaceae bacterium]|nr:hypothetical protein [Bifidobacteriaceae bacterium]